MSKNLTKTQLERTLVLLKAQWTIVEHLKPSLKRSEQLKKVQGWVSEVEGRLLELKRNVA